VTDRRNPVAAAREALGELGRDGPRLATFARGLALGALVGAAIAGTAMLDRRSRSRTPDPDARHPG
jgi:hypothetical protein